MRLPSAASIAGGSNGIKSDLILFLLPVLWLIDQL